ncbi:hypothetical protein AVEN_162978-1 [Araneus ventricosus]|uniref:Uncharacterized protein n=1 Tax=Araneus ventricosus TaxID=182803 RepID=A0A4Y2C050_ARAVE|nr:hypothetical protein AVEN_162978-1 [Araneus ventricosus]
MITPTLGVGAVRTSLRQRGRPWCTPGQKISRQSIARPTKRNYESTDDERRNYVFARMNIVTDCMLNGADELFRGCGFLPRGGFQ